jgi:ABC-type Fe3+/spermidine/putrescine transport system ATPase subunit
MLVTHNLTIKQDQTTILQNIDFTAAEGSTTALLGPSGSGKTTFLRALMGLTPLSSGVITWHGERLTEGAEILVAPHQRRFSMVFQEFILLPHLNVQQNIALSLHHLDKKERQEKVAALLQLFGLSSHATSSITALSGGEKQRVAFARALAPAPRVLLMDEPFSNLDKAFRHELYAQIRDILRQTATTTVLVTHDHHEAFFFSEQIYIFENGMTRQSGTPKNIYESPASPWIASFVGDVNTLSMSAAQAEGFCRDQTGDDILLVRPEKIKVARAAEGGAANGRVLAQSYLGPYEELVIKLLKSGLTLKVHDYDKQGLAVGSPVIVSL